MKKQQEEMEKFHKEMDAMAESTEKEILTVLSDEQKTEYKSLREERNNGRMMPPPMGQAGPPMNGMEYQNSPMVPMGQTGGQNPPMMRMPSMGQFGTPEMRREGSIPGRMMPPPPPGEMRDCRNAPQDKPAINKGKKGANKTSTAAKEKTE